LGDVFELGQALADGVRMHREFSGSDIREIEEIESANQSDRRPVVFVHGLWLLSSSWDRWRRLFEDAGYSTVAPGWPGDPETVDEARATPPSSRGKWSSRSPTATRRRSTV
jgi:pimeloyl-ACP methyl ester carboxylesterase